MKIALTISILFIIGISFFLGYWFAVFETTDIYRDQLKKAQMEIRWLETKASSQEWYIADEQRKNAAFREYIELEEK